MGKLASASRDQNFTSSWKQQQPPLKKRPRARRKNTADAPQIQGPLKQLLRKRETADDDQPQPQRLKRPWGWKKKTTTPEEEAVPQIQVPPPPRLKRPRQTKTTSDDDARPGLSSSTSQTSQIQIHPRCSLLRPCSAAAQDRLLRNRSSSTTTLHWGAKRSRTALGRRDWSDLDDGPAGLIAERVLDNGGVIDYIRFRAVCRPWRRCCADPRTRALLEDSRLHPRGWIMLLGEEEELEAAAAPHSSRRQFLNVSTGQCIQVDVPELQDHGVLQYNMDNGLLLLLRKGTGAVRLLNPLTRQAAELPPITDLEYPPAHIGRYSPSNAVLVDGRWVLLYIYRMHGTLAFAKPGDERWVLVKTTELLRPTMSFAGRFYGVTGDSIMVVDMTRGDDLPPRLVVAAKLAVQIRGMLETAHLVDNGGEMMLVHCRMRRVRGADGEYGDYKRTCKLYRVNLTSGRTTLAAARGRAIFVGHCRAVSVSPQVFPGISANAVYPALNLDKRHGHQQIVAYHLRDGTTESCSNNDTRSGLPHPWSISDCLAAYVSG